MSVLKKSSDIRGRIVVATIFMVLLCSFPYTFPRFFSIPELTIVTVLELLVLSFVFITLKKKDSLPKPFILICLTQIVVFLFLFVYHGDSFYIMRFALFVVLTWFSLFLVHNTCGIFKFIEINNVWLMIQAVLGLLGFVLIILNVIQPLLVSTVGDYGTDYFYGITTTNAIIGNIPRIAGFFDEPGAFAQWGVYALVLNRIIPCYNRKIEVLLIIGLMVTFSMAFYIQLVLYLILFNFSRVKKYIPILVVLIIGVFVARKYIPEDTDLYLLTFKRFEMSGGQLETNRDDAADVAKAYFIDSPIWGKGYSNLVKKETYFYDNPYETLASSGIIGTLALYLPLIVILLRYRKRGAWQAVAILSMGYLQRPFHIQYIHYLMIYFLFFACYYNNRTQTDAIER